MSTAKSYRSWLLVFGFEVHGLSRALLGRQIKHIVGIPKKLLLYANIAGGKVIRKTELTQVADLHSAAMQWACGVIRAPDVNLGKRILAFIEY